MAVEFKLPDLGEGVKAADVVKVLVKEGDQVSAGQNVLEVETDKAGLDVPVDVAGTVVQVLAKVGTKAKVGETVLVIEAGEVAPAPVAAPVAVVEAPAPVAAPAPAAAAPAAPAPAAAVVVPPPAPSAAPTAAPAGQPPVFASPAVRQFAREIGVDIHAVLGTGPHGRISVEDVKTHARTHGKVGASRTDASVPALAPAERDKWGDVRVEPISNVRRATAGFMAECWTTVPHVTIFHKVDVTELDALRLSLRPQAERAGVKLTLTHLLLKLLPAALAANPQLNASLDLANEQIIYKQYCHIGVAADTPRGLTVPVVRDVASKSLFDLAKELAELADTARRGKLAPDAMAGASFTVTNLGSLGTGFFTPIVPVPQAAILGMGRATREPVWDEAAGAFVPRLLLPLSLSFDHRLVDGADGARFLAWLTKAVTEPLRVLLEV